LAPGPHATPPAGRLAHRVATCRFPAFDATLDEAGLNALSLQGIHHGIADRTAAHAVEHHFAVLGYLVQPFIHRVRVAPGRAEDFFPGGIEIAFSAHVEQYKGRGIPQFFEIVGGNRAIHFKAPF